MPISSQPVLCHPAGSGRSIPNYPNCVLAEPQPIDQVHPLKLWIAHFGLAQSLGVWFEYLHLVLLVSLLQHSSTAVT